MSGEYRLNQQKRNQICARGRANLIAYMLPECSSSCGNPLQKIMTNTICRENKSLPESWVQFRMSFCNKQTNSLPDWARIRAKMFLYIPWVQKRPAFFNLFFVLFHYFFVYNQTPDQPPEAARVEWNGVEWSANHKCPNDWVQQKFSGFKWVDIDPFGL